MEDGDRFVSKQQRLTAEEERLLSTRPVLLSDKDKTKKNALRKRLVRANTSSRDRDQSNKSARRRKQLARDSESSKDRAQHNKRRRDNWANMNSDDHKAQRLERMRDISHDNWTNMNSKDRAERNIRRRKNYADMDSVAKAKKLKRKAEIEALQRAGFTRQEHERVMQQQRDAYYRRMSEMDGEAKAQFYERVRLKRRQQIGETCGPNFGVSVASLTI